MFWPNMPHSYTGKQTHKTDFVGNTYINESIERLYIVSQHTNNAPHILTEKALVLAHISTTSS